MTNQSAFSAKNPNYTQIPTVNNSRSFNKRTITMLNPTNHHHIATDTPKKEITASILNVLPGGPPSSSLTPPLHASKHNPSNMSLFNNELLLKNGGNARQIKIHIEEGKMSPEKSFFKALVAQEPGTRYPGLSTKKASIDTSY
jgi:hypothetical protein